ncbi:TonB family protein [Sulfurospirillum deleyianum DSM 6946]|uniref:TonB family protein n=2 Tax=Sulfurospirillum deleyianum TaxID=65553 RepID=D1B4Q7_SULD5|nr:TonB family protein [Sulfurospirillum deleyianum DSM 6946]
MLPKPPIRELIITEVSFLEELKPEMIHQEILQELPRKIKPIVEQKLEKKVPKVSAKTFPIQKPIQELVVEKTIHSNVPIKEQAEVLPVTPKAQEAPMRTTLSKRKDDLLLVYLAKVRDKIQESLRYPSAAKKMGIEGETVVQFLIHTNGMVDATSIKIAKSSGKVLLDRNAIDAVLEAVPFEFPPHEEIEIKVPVVFKLTS